MDEDKRARVVAELTAEYRDTVRRTAEDEQARRVRRGPSSPRSLKTAYALWFLLGGFGMHRLYLGRNLSGVVMLALGLATTVFTFLPDSGLPGELDLPLSIALGVWWLLDAFLIQHMMPDT
jgi:TM2 domain-containing membrane protein YozV